MPTLGTYQAPETGTLRHQVETGLQKIVNDGALEQSKFDQIKQRMWVEGIPTDLRKELALIFSRDRDAVHVERAQLKTRRAETTTALQEADREIAETSGEAAAIVQEAAIDMNKKYRETLTSITSEKSTDSVANLLVEATQHKEQLAHHQLLKDTLQGKNPPTSEKP